MQMNESSPKFLLNGFIEGHILLKKILQDFSVLPGDKVMQSRVSSSK